MNGILKNVMKYSKNKVYHNGSYYSKIRLPFKKNEKYLVLWEPKHSTNIHNHNGKNCVFMKVRGDFNEKVYKNDILVGENYYDLLLHMGEINDNIGKHSLKNISDEIGVSIHIYY